MGWYKIFEKGGAAAGKWNSPWCGIPLWLAAASLTTYWFTYPPSPGKAIGALAVVAGVMSVRDTKILGKMFWVVLLVCMAVTEFRAIDQDRADNDQKQRVFFETQKQEFSAVTTQAEGNFAATTSGLSVAIGGLNRDLETTQHVAETTQRNLDAISGEGSVPCIIPEAIAVVNNRIPFALWNRGKNNLTGVEVRVLSEREFLDPVITLEKPVIPVGTVNPIWPKVLPGIIPEMDSIESAEVGHYIFEIWTQNGFYTEIINFRHGKDQTPWAYQYWLTKLDRPADGKFKGTSRSIVYKQCESSEWSDDLNTGIRNAGPKS